jgi:hypothetical protein
MAAILGRIELGGIQLWTILIPNQVNLSEPKEVDILNGSILRQEMAWFPSQSHRILGRTSMASMARAKKGATSKSISAGCETAGSVFVLRGMMLVHWKKHICIIL